MGTRNRKLTAWPKRGVLNLEVLNREVPLTDPIPVEDTLLWRKVD